MPSPSIQETDRERFHVAIICALPLERDAVHLLVDDSTLRDLPRVKDDPNSYKAGKFQNHDVVFVTLPGMGVKDAATTATDLRRSFPAIKLALIVGVCGGLPMIPMTDGKDAFLGDVIISTHVFQYDLARRFPKKQVPKTDVTNSLSRPAKEIRALIASLDAHQLQADATVNLKRLQAKAQGCYEPLPGVEDGTFPSAYIHRHYRESCDDCDSDTFCEDAARKTCAEVGCDTTKLVARAGREVQRPKGPHVFMGGVASGSQVMKSADHRDAIVKICPDVVGFEMEGAGAWDEFPCIVVKGICDYADSHKSKKSQHYAAATGASVAAALLGRAMPWAETEAAASSPLLEQAEGNATVHQYNIRNSGGNYGVQGGVSGSHNAFTFGK